MECGALMSARPSSLLNVWREYRDTFPLEVIQPCAARIPSGEMTQLPCLRQFALLTPSYERAFTQALSKATQNPTR